MTLSVGKTIMTPPNYPFNRPPIYDSKSQNTQQTYSSLPTRSLPMYQQADHQPQDNHNLPQQQLPAQSIHPSQQQQQPPPPPQQQFQQSQSTMQPNQYQQLTNQPPQQPYYIQPQSQIYNSSQPSYVYANGQTDVRSSSITSIQYPQNFQDINSTNIPLASGASATPFGTAANFVPPNAPNRSQSISNYRFQSSGSSISSNSAISLSSNTPNSSVNSVNSNSKITKPRRKTSTVKAESISEENPLLNSYTMGDQAYTQSHHSKESIEQNEDSKSPDSLKSESVNPEADTTESSVNSSALPTNNSVNEQPAKKTRSRYGCLTCRARKKRCSESKPQCKECERLGLACKWANPNVGNKNKSKNKLGYDEMYHETFGVIKILRGIVDYKVKDSEYTWKRPGYTANDDD